MTAPTVLDVLVLEPLRDLAAAYNYAAAYPDPVKPPRADGCPECGAFPEIGVASGHAPRSYRAWVPTPDGRERCTSTWHDGEES